MITRTRIAYALWRNRPTRGEAWPFLLGRQQLTDWEVDLLLKGRREK